MSSRTSTITERELLALERDYWDAMKDRDARTAGRLTGEDCTIVGASGVFSVGPRQMGELLEGATYRIKAYRIDPETMRTAYLCDDTVAVAYRSTRISKSTARQSSSMPSTRRSGRRATQAGTVSSIPSRSPGDAFGRDRVANKAVG